MKIFILPVILFLCFAPILGMAQEVRKVETEGSYKFSYLIENGGRMIREKEIEKVFNLIAELPQEKKGDFRVRVIENFLNLKAYLISKKKEYGKRWQMDYKPILYTGNKTATPILVDLLKDSDPYIRAFTARALAYLGDFSALEELERIRNSDPNSKVRAKAEWAYECISGRKMPP